MIKIREICVIPQVLGELLVHKHVRLADRKKEKKFIKYLCASVDKKSTPA